MPPSTCAKKAAVKMAPAGELDTALFQAERVWTQALSSPTTTDPIIPPSPWAGKRKRRRRKEAMMVMMMLLVVAMMVMMMMVASSSSSSSSSSSPVLLSCLLGHLGVLWATPEVGGQAQVEVQLLLPPKAQEEEEEKEEEEGGRGGGHNHHGTSTTTTLQGSLLLLEDPNTKTPLKGNLVLVGDTDPKLEDEDSWIGVVPVGEEQAETPRGKEESFTTTVVNKMKRALFLGASALLILALNQNAIRELDVSQVLSKPVILVQTSENVTKLFGALLRGLRATAKITYQAVLLENVGVTLTLWSTCGLSRGGLYGEWQGVICTGENSSRVQKYLQQLWNAILFIAFVLCTGVIMQAQRQSRQSQLEQDSEPDLKQHIARRLSALKTRRYHPGKAPRSWAHEIDSCAICLDQFHKNQCLRVLPCLHEFHRDCVDPWLLLQQTCPLCKHNILANFQES